MELAAHSSVVPGPAAGPSPETEVIVVGAGPTGLMTTVLLARRGVAVRVFDKNTQQAHESRALAVQARSVELFLSLGLAGALIDHGGIVTGGRMCVDGQSAAEFSFDNIGRADTPYSAVLVVPQRDTEAILNDELQRLGVTVERQVEVTGFEPSAQGVTVRAKGADGAGFEARAASRDPGRDRSPSGPSPAWSHRESSATSGQPKRRTARRAVPTPLLR